MIRDENGHLLHVLSERRHCEQCGSRYSARTTDQRVCSWGCARKLFDREHPDAVQYSRKLKVARRCALCESTFNPGRRGQRCCSIGCAQRLFAIEHPDARKLEVAS